MNRPTGRLTALLEQGEQKTKETEQQAADDAAVSDELERLDFKPDDIPSDVWDLIQENGRVATERLHDILLSPRFMRFRPGDQAKLIALAQNRAYGTPKQNRVDDNKRRGAMVDVTANELGRLVERSALPEYKRSISATVIEDAEEL